MLSILVKNDIRIRRNNYKYYNRNLLAIVTCLFILLISLLLIYSN